MPHHCRWACKSGKSGANEEFTLTNGQLCSTSLGNGDKLCLKPEATPPPHSAPHPGNGQGFDCVADPAVRPSVVDRTYSLEECFWVSRSCWG